MPYAPQERLTKPRRVNGLNGSEGLDMNSVLNTRWNSSMQELCQEKGALAFNPAKRHGTRLCANHAGSAHWLAECPVL